MKQQPVTFGARLQALREACGITRRDLAARVQLSETYLEKVERGYSAPPASATITRLVRSLHADADELFSLANRIPPDLEHALKHSALLLQVLRAASTSDMTALTHFLRSQDVPEVKIKTASTCVPLGLDDEQRCTREPITADLRRAVFKLDNFECVYCSAQAILEADHIFPHSLGGTSEPDNLITACHKCNLKKKNRAVPFPMVFGRFRQQIEGGA